MFTKRLVNFFQVGKVRFGLSRVAIKRLVADGHATIATEALLKLFDVFATALGATVFWFRTGLFFFYRFISTIQFNAGNVVVDLVYFQIERFDRIENQTRLNNVTMLRDSFQRPAQTIIVEIFSG